MALAALPRAAVPQAPPSLRLDTPTAVDMAGRLRMLSQRSTKAYLQWGQSIAADNARALLQESVARFEAHLAALKTFQPTPVVQASLPPLETRWTDFKAMLAGTPSRDGAAALYDASELLQQAAHRTTVAYENATGSPLDHLVGIAGRQRMLSQRMAKFYMQKRRGFNLSEVNDGLEQARSEFKGALQELIASPQNTPAIRKELELAKMQWVFFENALAQENAQDPTFAVNVATSSERILEIMDRVTGMYEKL
jgi:hypothetical protein